MAGLDKYRERDQSLPARFCRQSQESTAIFMDWHRVMTLRQSSLRLSAKAPGRDRILASQRGGSCHKGGEVVSLHQCSSIIRCYIMFSRGYTLNSILASRAITVAVKGECHAATSKSCYWVMFETSEPSDSSFNPYLGKFRWSRLGGVSPRIPWNHWILYIQHVDM